MLDNVPFAVLDAFLIHLSTFLVIITVRVMEILVARVATTPMLSPLVVKSLYRHEMFVRLPANGLLILMKATSWLTLTSFSIYVAVVTIRATPNLNMLRSVGGADRGVVADIAVDLDSSLKTATSVIHHMSCVGDIVATDEPPKTQDPKAAVLAGFELSLDLTAAVIFYKALSSHFKVRGEEDNLHRNLRSSAKFGSLTPRRHRHSAFVNVIGKDGKLCT